MTDSRKTFPRAGFSLLELLVAMIVALAVLSAVVAAFVSIMRVAKDSETLLYATANARAGLRTLSDELKQATNTVDVADFVGENVALTYGDGIDNDGDGSVDEEQPNGLDDDGDWNQAAIPHATAITLQERPNRVSQPDWGDFGVDEDNLFHRDRLRMRLVPLDETDYAFRDVVYEVTSFEGENLVLMREETRFDAVGAPTETSYAPLAYQVLSFNCLYWNPNALPETQYWQETWYAGTYQPVPGFFAPAGVLVELVVYADKKPIDAYQSGQPVETVRVPTIVNIEGVIQDDAFPRNP